jgi:trehalose synthase-fused probable maltokinase
VAADVAAGGATARATLAQATWLELFEPAWRERLAAALLEYALPRRWFRGKARRPTGARVRDLVRLGAEAGALAILEVAYEDGGDPEPYVLALVRVDAARAAELDRERPNARIARLSSGDGLEDGLMDGLATGEVGPALWRLMGEEGVRYGMYGGRLQGLGVRRHGLARPHGGISEARGRAPAPARVRVRVPEVEQTNSILVLGTEVLLKVYRRLTAGPNPELELGGFLTERSRPPIVPEVLGALAYFPGDPGDPGDAGDAGDPASPELALSLGIAHAFVANDGDAWSVVLPVLTHALGEASATSADRGDASEARAAECAHARIEAWTRDPHATPLAALAAAIGRRTGGLHLALVSADLNLTAFAAEPFTHDDRRTLATRTLDMLEAQLAALSARRERLPPTAAAVARRLAEPEAEAAARALAEGFARPRTPRVAAELARLVKLRIHGDLHLGQVLVRGDDVTIIDFEGEPSRPLVERRAKGSPFRDVMGMARSFDYAAESAVRRSSTAPGVAGPASARLRALGQAWRRSITAVFEAAYLETVGAAPFVPRDPEALALLRGFFTLEKVVYEIRYELDHRPDWVEIPLRGLAELVGLGLDRGGGPLDEAAP